MVKPSRVLEGVAAEADVPYEATRLARRAARARPRLAILLLLGAAGFALEAALTRAPGMALGAIALAGSAWGARAGRLGGVIAAALAALLGALIPFALLLLGDRATGERVMLGFIIAWALAMLPDVLTLVRDAELQYAYGRWAKRAP